MVLIFRVKLHHCIVIRVFPLGSSVVLALITRLPGGGTVLWDSGEPSLLSGTRRCEAEAAGCAKLEPEVDAAVMGPAAGRPAGGAPGGCGLR